MQGLRLQQRFMGGLWTPMRTHARWCEIAAASVLAFFVVCAIWVSRERGPWLDELWSLWQAQHDLPLAQILQERWMADFHPPLFSFAHWLVEPSMGEAIFAHRLLNLVPLAWTTLFVVVLLRRLPDAAPFVLVLALLTLSLPTPLEYFAESRSYFGQLAATFALVAATIAILGSREDFDRQRDVPLAAMLAATIVAALNLHYTTSLLLGLMLFGAAALAWLRGRRGWALALALPAAVGGLLLVVTVAAQRHFLGQAAGSFWVQGDLQQAFVILARYFANAVRVNPVATFAFVAALLVTVATALGLPTLQRRIAAQPAAAALVLPAEHRATALLFGATALAFAAGMLLVHAWRPIVIGKYIMSYQIVALGLVACLIAPAVARYRWLLALLAAATVATLAVEAAATRKEERWDATARIVARLHAQCPSSPIHAAVPPSQVYSRNAQDVLRWSYGKVAEWHGFAVRDLDLRGAAVPAPAGPCPALLWIEHVHLPSLPLAGGPGAVLGHYGLPAKGVDLERAKLFTGETGFVLQLPFARSR